MSLNDDKEYQALVGDIDDAFVGLNHAASVLSVREIAAAQRFIGGAEEVEKIAFSDSLIHFLQRQVAEVCDPEIHQQAQEYTRLLGNLLTGELVDSELKQVEQIVLSLRKNADKVLRKFIDVFNFRVFSQFAYSMSSTEVDQKLVGEFYSRFRDLGNQRAVASIFAIAGLDNLATMHAGDPAENVGEEGYKVAKEIQTALAAPGVRAAFYLKLALHYREVFKSVTQLIPFSSIEPASLFLGFDDLKLVRQEQDLACPTMGLNLLIYCTLKLDTSRLFASLNLTSSEAKPVQEAKKMQISTHLVMPQYTVDSENLLAINLAPATILDFIRREDAKGLLDQVEKILQPYRSSMANLAGSMYVTLDDGMLDINEIDSQEASNFIRNALSTMEGIILQGMCAVDSNEMDEIYVDMESGSVTTWAEDDHEGERDVELFYLGND